MNVCTRVYRLSKLLDSPRPRPPRLNPAATPQRDAELAPRGSSAGRRKITLSRRMIWAARLMPCEVSAAKG
jgi:hypothetical protein